MKNKDFAQSYELLLKFPKGKTIRLTAAKPFMYEGSKVDEVHFNTLATYRIFKWISKDIVGRIRFDNIKVKTQNKSDGSMKKMKG